MAALLKSISKQIHWSLLGRAAVFALAWFFLPGWLFFVVAIALYSIPPFRTKDLAIPFLVLFGMCLVGTPSVMLAIVYGILFYGILLIKDLLVIDRRSGQGMLVMALSFLLFREFFLLFTTGATSGAIWVALVVAIAVGAMVASIITDHEEIDLRRIAIWSAILITFQTLVVCLFLPVDFIYQSIIAFLVMVAFIDLVPSYFSRELSFSRVRGTVMIIFSLLVVVLASASWGI
jgi:hypothetical protein